MPLRKSELVLLQVKTVLERLLRNISIFFRVVTVLLDKPEIGPLIIDKISLDVFRTLHHMFQVIQ